MVATVCASGVDEAALLALAAAVQAGSEHPLRVPSPRPRAGATSWSCRRARSMRCRAGRTRPRRRSLRVCRQPRADG
ncbi:MAG: hypothetical protein R3E48_12680 [Burkholderiaceae bacterium]